MHRMLALALTLAVALASLPVPFALAAGPTVTPTPPSSVNIVIPNVTPPPLSNVPVSSVGIKRAVPPPAITPTPPPNTFPPSTPPPNTFLPNTPAPTVPIVFPVPPPPATPTQGLGTVNDFATLGDPGNTSFQPGVFNPFDNPHPMLPWGDGQVGAQRYGQVIRYWENQPQTVHNVRFEQQAAPPQELNGNPPAQQGQPAAPGQGALDAKLSREPAARSVTVPAYWIIETQRGYLHMPRWVLQEVGDGRYRWALVSGWFQYR
jgi:hypothetical protein